MKQQNQKVYLLPLSITFIGLPLLLWKLGDFPQRTALKESLSVLTFLAFFLMLGMFFLTRSGQSILKDLNMANAVKLHKFIGYTVIVIILVHPFLIVLPRYFEAGVEPMEALKTILTTFDSLGIVLGIVAWGLMLLLTITSLFRKVLPLKYKTWRYCHGVLSILFISIATWHAVDLGRHTNRPMTITMIILAGTGVVLLLKTYIVDTCKKTVKK